MSLATYIGTNIELPADEEYTDLYDDDFWIGDCFSDKYNKKAMKKHHFSTNYVYEVSSHWGITISKNSSTCYESIAKLNALIKHLKNYLQPGDSFQLYSCWIGEENEKSEGNLTFTIGEFSPYQIEIPEKIVVTFQF